MLLCIVILQMRLFSYFLNLFENLFGEELILYKTHFGKCFYCLNPRSFRRRLRDDGSSSVGTDFMASRDLGSTQTPYLKWTYRMFLCRKSGMGQTSEKTALFQQWKEEGTALFKNMQWLLGHQSLSLKQTRPHVWDIDSEKWGEGKEERKG